MCEWDNLVKAYKRGISDVRIAPSNGNLLIFSGGFENLSRRDISSLIYFHLSHFQSSAYFLVAICRHLTEIPIDFSLFAI